MEHPLSGFHLVSLSGSFAHPRSRLYYHPYRKTFQVTWDGRLTHTAAIQRPLEAMTEAKATIELLKDTPRRG